MRIVFTVFMAALATYIWIVQVDLALHDDLFHVTEPVRVRLERLAGWSARHYKPR